MLAYLKKNSDLVVNEIVDTNGKTLLHECTFNNSVKCLNLLLQYASTQLTQPQITAWVNMKDHGDGFTALHFGSFKGNPEVCELLINQGADVNGKNNFGINMLHVAA